MTDYSRALYKRNFGQKITTDVEGYGLPRAFLAHFHIPAASAPAASSDGVHALMNLGAAVQEITTGITNPAVPRNIRIDGNVAGINGAVTITGTNYAGEEISEEITANGTTAVDGALAFKTVTKIDLPAQVHTPVAQVETIAVTGGATGAGDAVITVTAAGMTNSPKAVTVALAAGDNEAAEAAAKIRAALVADADVAAFFNVSGADANVILTAKAPAANDATLALALTDAGTTGITVGASGDTTAGVPYDKISVGWGDKFGLPYMLYADELVILKLFNKAADTGTVTEDADELEKNVFDPNGTPDGLKDIDLYIIV
jgi:hypothetical protein